MAIGAVRFKSSGLEVEAEDK